jgi:pimeloyl-ACP methyl ester carboxylesterase
MRSSKLALLVTVALAGCRQNSAPRDETGPLVVEEPRASKPATLGPIRMELLDPEEAAPMYVLRGGPKGSDRLVFLHGMCGHALGYAQSFQFSAAKQGLLIAPQGDRRCGKGPWAMWSSDLEALDARIMATFRALGEKEPIRDVLIMGYSQGATRAEALARQWPERYTRLISLGAPRAASARGLEHLRGAVMMAGELDRQDQMKAGMRALRAAGVPVTFIEIPGARHGAMGKNPEQTMGTALDWLAANARK